MNKLLTIFLLTFFWQLSFAQPIKIEFHSAFVNVDDPNDIAPADLFDFVDGYLIFDSTTPDTNSTSIPQGDSGTDEFGEFIGAITDIFITFNGLEFRLDNTSPNYIETASYAGTAVNFYFEAVAKLNSFDTVLDFFYSTEGVRIGTIPDPTDSLPRDGDYAGGDSILTLSSTVNNYELTAETGVEMFYVVPVPAALWLFGSGILGLIGVARRVKR